MSDNLWSALELLVGVFLDLGQSQAINFSLRTDRKEPNPIYKNVPAFTTMVSCEKRLEHCVNIFIRVNMQHKKLPGFRHTCVGVDTIIGFYHNEACISSTRSGSKVGGGGGGGRGGGAGSDSRSQSDGQSGGVVPPRLPLKT